MITEVENSNFTLGECIQTPTAGVLCIHTYFISAYIIQALAMGSTENCFLQVSNTTTKGIAMCTNNI